MRLCLLDARGQFGRYLVASQSLDLTVGLETDAVELWIRHGRKRGP